MNVVLFTSGSAGDILPFVRVGAALAARGHPVTLVSHARYDRLAADAGLAYRPFDTDDAYGEYLRHASLLNTPGGITRFLRDHSLPRAPAALAQLDAVLDGDSLLVTSPTFDAAARIAAEIHGLDPLWLFIAPVQVSAWPRRRAVRSAMFSRVLGSAIEEVRASAGLSPIRDWDAWLAYSRRSLGQWPDWFAAADEAESPDEAWLPGVVPVGFLIDHPAERSALPGTVSRFIAAEADRGSPPPLLVTGGTGRYLGEAFYANALAAARQLDLAAIVVTRDQDCLPAERPERCLVLDHLPFGVVMPHCSTVIHHGGLGTTGAAAAAGVPQLILAFGADRPDNGARVERCGIGASIALPQCTVEAVVAALQGLTTSEALRGRCAKASTKILARDSASAAAEVAEAFYGERHTQ